MGVKSRTREYFFLHPLRIRERINNHKGYEGGRNIRLPRIHNKDPFSFHSWNVLPSINHPAVPPWWISHTVLWLIDGSGGESHARNLSRNWFPVMVYQPRCSAIWVSGRNKRFISWVSVFGRNEKTVSKAMETENNAYLLWRLSRYHPHHG